MAKPCKHGKLKHPVGGRRCKKALRHAKARAKARKWRAASCAGPITSSIVTDKRGRVSTRCTCLTQRAVRCPAPPVPGGRAYGIDASYETGEGLPSLDGALGAWRRRSRF